MQSAFEAAQQTLRDPALEQEVSRFLRDDAAPRVLIDGASRSDDPSLVTAIDLHGLEAIVQRFGRPSLLTWNGQHDPLDTAETSGVRPIDRLDDLVL